jgi:hypothetical protein
VAEGARLESVFTRKGNVGSNPTLSAILQNHSQECGFRDPLTIVHAVALAACSHCAYYQDVEIVGSDVNERLGAV